MLKSRDAKIHFISTIDRLPLFRSQFGFNSIMTFMWAFLKKRNSWIKPARVQTPFEAIFFPRALQSGSADMDFVVMPRYPGSNKKDKVFALPGPRAVPGSALVILTVVIVVFCILLFPTLFCVIHVAGGYPPHPHSNSYDPIPPMRSVVVEVVCWWIRVLCY